MNNKKTRKRIHVSFPDTELLEAVFVAARNEGRSISNYIVNVLNNHIKKEENVNTQ